MPYPGAAPYQGYIPNNGPIIPEIHQITQHEAENVASDLYGAFKGLGANHAEIIKILSSHNKVQLSAISRAYYAKYGQTLESRIKSELMGNYEALAIALLRPPFAFEAAFLKKAIADPEALNFDIIAAILTSRTQQDVQQIMLAGMQVKRTKPGKQPKVKKNLMQEILKATASDKKFHDLCNSIFMTRRETGPADPARAERDAKDLVIAAKGIGCDSKTFIALLTGRSYPQIRKIAENVEIQKKMSLKKLICKEFMGVMEKSLVNLMYMATSPAHAQAYVMYRAMKGLGTDDTTLIEAIAYIYDNDMLDKVKTAFKEITGKDLIKTVESETSLNYKKLCVALLNYKGKKHNVNINSGY